MTLTYSQNERTPPVVIITSVNFNIILRAFHGSWKLNILPTPLTRTQSNLWTSLEDKNRQHQMSRMKFLHKPGRSSQIYFWVLSERDRKISELKFLSKLFHVLCINLDLFFREHVEQQDKSFLHFLSVICHAMPCTHTHKFLPSCTTW